MKKIEINIRKPDDGHDYYTTYIQCDLFQTGRESITVSPDRSAKDPIHKAMKDMFKGMLKQPRQNRWGYSSRTNYFGEDDFNGVFWIRECPLALSRTNGKYKINGKAESMMIPSTWYCIRNSMEVLISLFSLIVAKTV